MLTTKSRKQRSSVVLTLPSNNGQKPKTDQEYTVMYSNDGTITLVPKLQDPFSGGSKGEYYEKDEWYDIEPGGRELF
ncbi:type II toxin-antitoxin system PemI/MazE family antitoxin [Enterococcus faecalis]